MECFKITYNITNNDSTYCSMYIIAKNINKALDLYKETYKTILSYVDSEYITKKVQTIKDKYIIKF